jgi:hypothetical protein
MTTWSVPEQILQGFATLLALNKPAAVPALARDRWLDIDSVDAPAMYIAGWEDDPDPEQGVDRPIDVRRLKVTFVLFGKKSTGVTASQAVDVMVQWIQAQLNGIPEGETNPLLRIVLRVSIGKKAAVVEKGVICRALVEVVADYRVLMKDVTNWG